MSNYNIHFVVFKNVFFVSNFSQFPDPTTLRNFNDHVVSRIKATFNRHNPLKTLIQTF